MTQRTLLFAIGSASLALALSCSDDDVQPNPHFTAGTSSVAGEPAAGETGSELGGFGNTLPGGGASSGGTPGAAGSGDAAEGGTAGAPPDEPPYDCVLRPRTHLEIINACTDATRIEKHPDLPPIP